MWKSCRIAEFLSKLQYTLQKMFGIIISANLGKIRYKQSHDVLGNSNLP